MQHAIFNMLKPIFCKKPIYDKSQFMAKATLCQKPILGKSQYLAKVNKCNMQFAIGNMQ
jgi:hypothetical protein